jgi:hypothetical protein
MPWMTSAPAVGRLGGGHGKDPPSRNTALAFTVQLGYKSEVLNKSSTEIRRNFVKLLDISGRVHDESIFLVH